MKIGYRPAYINPIPKLCICLSWGENGEEEKKQKKTR